MTDIYPELARHLDNLPGGYPATETGVELRILKRLFTEEEAALAVKMTVFPETAEDAARRLSLDPAELETKLNDMSRKGLLLRSTKGEKIFYMAAQFVVGIWEFHVNDLDEGLIRDFNEYAPYLTEAFAKIKTQQLRVIPVSKSISAEMQVMPYEEAENIIKSQKKLLVAPCICRKEHKMVGKGCGKLEEACLVFGGSARYYEENGLGRYITTEEALDILHKGIEEGLVLQPGNSQKPSNICMCCGCCCQILKNVKNLEKPAQVMCSSYYATVDEDACIACGICEERCPMDAIAIEDTAVINLDRCIGCGVCIAGCEVEALSLTAKEENEKWVPPKNLIETYMNIGKERGLF